MAALAAAPGYTVLPKTSFGNLFYNALGETVDPRDPTGKTGIQTLSYPPTAAGAPGTSGNNDLAPTTSTSTVITPTGGTVTAGTIGSNIAMPPKFYAFSVPGGASPGETYTKLVLGVAKAATIIGAPSGSQRYIMANWSLDPSSNMYSCVIALLV